jgi:hypothetical protein
MADVTLTTGWPKMIATLGQLSLYLYKVTDIDDGETLDTDLGGRILSHWVNWIGNPGTQAAGGGHSVNSSGTITFYPSTDSLDGEVYVLATGM